MIRLDENNYQIWKDMSLDILRNSPNNIDVSLTFGITDLKLTNAERTSKVLFFLCKVGKVNCPVLLVNGCDDQNWAVTEYAKDVSKHTHTHTAYSGHVYSLVSCWF